MSNAMAKQNQRGGIVAAFLTFLSVLVVLTLAGALAVDFLRSRVEIAPIQIGLQKGNSLILARYETQWKPVFMAAHAYRGDMILSAPKGFVELGVPGSVRLRLEKNSLIRFENPPWYRFAKKQTQQAQLISGSVLAHVRSGSPYGDFQIDLFSPLHEDPSKDIRDQKRKRLAAVRLREGFLALMMDHETKTYTCYLLWGHAELRIPGEKNKVVKVTLNDHEVLEASAEPLTVKQRPLVLTDWKNVRIGYEWAGGEGFAQDVVPNDLGTLSWQIKTIGALFNQGASFSDSRYLRDETGSILELEYDVFLPGNLAGIYFETKGLLLAAGQKITFEARTLKPSREKTRAVIEFKSGNSILKSQVIGIPPERWEAFEFPVDFSSARKVTEITIVMKNETNQPGDRGVIQLRNLDLDEPARSFH